MTTKKNNQKTKHSSTVPIVIAAGALTALGAYFIYGTKAGKPVRKAIKGWMIKAKGEILEKLEEAGDLTESAYHNVVEEVLSKYRNLKNVTAEDLAMLAGELRGSWVAIQKQLKNSGKKAKGTVKRGATKAKKTAKGSK